MVSAIKHLATGEILISSFLSHAELGFQVE
jgi:hypothetical protein